MRILIAAFELLLAIPGLSLGQSEPRSAKAGDEQELAKLEHGWTAFVARKDLAALDRPLADDCLETGFEGAVNTRERILAGLRSGEFSAFSMTAQQIKVRVYGIFAVVTGPNITTARSRGRDLSGEYRWTDTWLPNDGSPAVHRISQL
jgi:hypothetical protein